MKQDDMIKETQSMIDALDRSSGGQVAPVIAKADKLLVKLTRAIEEHLKRYEENLVEAKEDLVKYPNTKWLVLRYEKTILRTKNVLDAVERSGSCYADIISVFFLIRAWARP